MEAFLGVEVMKLSEFSWENKFLSERISFWKNYHSEKSHSFNFLNIPFKILVSWILMNKEFWNPPPSKFLTGFFYNLTAFLSLTSHTYSSFRIC
jgi:hypothetical protein